MNFSQSTTQSTTQSTQVSDVPTWDTSRVRNMMSMFDEAATYQQTTTNQNTNPNKNKITKTKINKNML